MRNLILAGIAVYLYLLTKPEQTMPRDTRGLRNNNPGNIKETGTTWKGQVKPTTDPPFAQFETFVYGLRAMIVLVKRTYRNMGLNTIRGIVSRYAPPIENETQAYIASVSRRTGIDPDRILSTEDDYRKVIKAMAFHENGKEVVTDFQYNEAIRLI